MAVTATYTLSVDWNNDGDWSDANEDITAYVLREHGMEWAYGRDRASQLAGRSTAGQFRCVLKNTDGRFSSFNASGPLYGNLVPGRKVRLQVTDGVVTATFVWFLATLEPQPVTRNVNVALLTAVGPLGWLNDPRRKTSLAMTTSILTGDAADDILDEAGWPAGDRSIDAGQTTMKRHWSVGESPLAALRRVEATESGFLRESRDGKVVFESRHHRLAGAHLTSQATYTDALGGTLSYRRAHQEDPLAEVFNRFEAEVPFWTVGATAVLWTLGQTGADSPRIDPGQSVEFWATYPRDPGRDPRTGRFTSANAAVDAWTTPVSTTDFLTNSQADGLGTNLTASMAVAAVKTANSMKVTLTNNHATLAAYVTFLQARGTGVTAGDPARVVREDSASQTAYGERSFPHEGGYLPSVEEAGDWAAFNLSIYKAPRPPVSLLVAANRSAAQMTEALTRDVSDRITVVGSGASQLGMNGAFFVERITHRVDGSKRHLMTLECSPAEGFGGFMVLDTGPGLDTGRLGY